MQLAWLTDPLTAYAMTGAGLVASLALFGNIRWEIAKNGQAESAGRTERAAERAAIGALQAEVETLRESVRELQELPHAHPAGPGIDLTRRAQALRMHRRGESIPSIAAALETPGNEIALLLKVHGLTNETVEKAS
jgi:hypothetical protein